MNPQSTLSLEEQRYIVCVQGRMRFIISAFKYLVIIGRKMTWIPAYRILGCGGNRQIHTDYRVLWRKRNGTATLSRGERL